MHLRQHTVHSNGQQHSAVAATVTETGSMGAHKVGVVGRVQVCPDVDRPAQDNYRDWLACTHADTMIQQDRQMSKTRGSYMVSKQQAKTAAAEAASAAHRAVAWQGPGAGA